VLPKPRRRGRGGRRRALAVSARTLRDQTRSAEEGRPRPVFDRVRSGKRLRRAVRSRGRAGPDHTEGAATDGGAEHRGRGRATCRPLRRSARCRPDERPCATRLRRRSAGLAPTCVGPTSAQRRETALVGGPDLHGPGIGLGRICLRLGRRRDRRFRLEVRQGLRCDRCRRRTRLRRRLGRWSRGWSRRRCCLRFRGGSRNGRRGGYGSRSRRGCRSRSRSARLSARPRRQEAKRVEVCLLVRGEADAEVDVGLLMLGLSGRARERNPGALRDDCATTYRRGTEMRQRHGISIRCLHRDHEPAARHLADERHLSSRRCKHGFVVRGSDVDTAVLSRRVRVGAQVEGTQHGAARRPRPGTRGTGCEQQQTHGDGHHLHSHRALLPLCGMRRTCLP
jgi:hypothetical protein